LVLLVLLDHCLEELSRLMLAGGGAFTVSLVDRDHTVVHC
jgi:hypothetical protein